MQQRSCLRSRTMEGMVTRGCLHSSVRDGWSCFPLKNLRSMQCFWLLSSESSNVKGGHSGGKIGCVYRNCFCIKTRGFPPFCSSRCLSRSSLLFKLTVHLTHRLHKRKILTILHLLCLGWYLHSEQNESQHVQSHP